MALRFRLVARFGGRGRSLLSPYVLLSFTGHVLFVGAMILLPSLRGRPTIPDDALIVDLVAPAVSAPPASRLEAPPPAEPPPGVRAEPQAPPEPVRLPKKPPPEKSREKKEEKPVPAPRPIPPSVPETRSNPAPGEAAQGPPGGAPPGLDTGSITPMEGGDLEFAWYRASVTAALYSHWRKPILDGSSEPYEVRVTFDIMTDGQVRNLRIDRSSGVPSLDRSALRAVSDAAPLPALPPNWGKPVLPAGFVFRLHLE